MVTRWKTPCSNAPIARVRDADEAGVADMWRKEWLSSAHLRYWPDIVTCLRTPSTRFTGQGYLHPVSSSGLDCLYVQGIAAQMRNLAGRRQGPHGVLRDKFRNLACAMRISWKQCVRARFALFLIVLSNLLAVNSDTELCSIPGQMPLLSEACASVLSCKQR
jgi:hypothetical protein